MKSVSSLLGVVLLSMLLGACAQPGRLPVPAGADKATAEVPAVAGPRVEEEPLEPDVLYDILVGEIAGQRRALDTAVEHYLQAALASRDPRVAERALRSALYAKDRASALRAARRWVEIDPQNARAHHELAGLELAVGNRDAALREFQYLLKQADDPRKGYRQVTAIAARVPDKARAVDVVGQLAAADPREPEAQLAHARVAAAAERWDSALASVGRALKLRPGWAEAIVLAATVEVKAGDREAALRRLRKAVDQHPRDTQLRMAYARLLLDADDYEGARDAFARVIRLEDDNVDARYALALLETELGNLEQAERHFRKLIKLDERADEARYYLGRIAEQKHERKEAARWYKQVGEGEYWLDAQVRLASLRARAGDLEGGRARLQQLRNRNPHIAVRLYLIEGEMLMRAGRYRAAMDMYNGLLEGDYPDNKDLLYARALVAEKLDDIALAEADLRRVVEMDPDNAHAWNALGYTLADRTDRVEEAYEYISKALELAPREPAIVDSMGWVHYRLGNLDEAERYLRRAYELSHGDGEIGAHLGEVLWVKGDRAGARSIWEDARRIDPDNPALIETLERFGQ